LLPRRRGYVGAFSNKLEFQPFGRFSHEPFVRVARASAQLVIEVGHHHPPAVPLRQALQDMKKNHRIHSARNSDKNGLAATEEPAGADGIFDGIDQVAHSVIFDLNAGLMPA
jgi:hypothetical protein